MTRRPAWLPLAAAVCAFALFILLGLWQLQRAEERRADFAAIERATERAPVPLPAGADALEALAWQPVFITGRLLADRQFLVDNRTHQGRAGFDVLVPMVLDDGRTILVDRGWVPADAGARQPAAPVDDALPARAVVRGRLWLPQPGIALGPAVLPEGDWPRLMMRFEFAALGEALGRELVPAVVRASGDAPWLLQSRPVTPRFGPERHLGYAVQWFALALTVLIVTLLLMFRSRRTRDHESSGQ